MPISHNSSSRLSRTARSGSQLGSREFPRAASNISSRDSMAFKARSSVATSNRIVKSASQFSRAAKLDRYKGSRLVNWHQSTIKLDFLYNNRTMMAELNCREESVGI